jgi:transposase
VACLRASRRGFGSPVKTTKPEIRFASLKALSSEFAKDSGKKTSARRIKAGRAAPRPALYLAAMNGARFNPVLKATYERMLEAGKPKKVALIALARKLLTILIAIVREEKDRKGAAA